MNEKLPRLHRPRDRVDGCREVPDRERLPIAIHHGKTHRRCLREHGVSPRGPDHGDTENRGTEFPDHGERKGKRNVTLLDSTRETVKEKSREN